MSPIADRWARPGRLVANRHLVILGLLAAYLLGANFIFDDLIPVRNESRRSRIEFPTQSDALRQDVGAPALARVGWKDVLSFSGWALLPDRRADQSRVYLLLQGDRGLLVFDTTRHLRPDLPANLKRTDLGYEHAGFTATVPAPALEDGVYRLGVGIECEQGRLFQLGNAYFTKRGLEVASGFDSRPQELTGTRSDARPRFTVDDVSFDLHGRQAVLLVLGWAAAEGRTCDQWRRQVVLRSEKATLGFEARPQRRVDVRKVLRREAGEGYDSCGFLARIPVAGIPAGRYSVGVGLVDTVRLDGWSGRWVDVSGQWLRLGSAPQGRAPGPEEAATVALDLGELAAAEEPGAWLDRGQLARLVGRLRLDRAEPPRAATGTVYRDVTVTTKDAAWIEAVAPLGFIPGKPDGSFGPAEHVDRGELAGVLERLLHGADHAPPAVSSSGFTDVAADSTDAPWVSGLQRDLGGVGCGGGRFCPRRAATRREALRWLALVPGASAAGR